ncbi:MAG: hypothetical protein AAFQ87_08180 [Bacteroidota bacterium]
MKQLEPSFQKGTIIYADNVDMSDVKPFLDYVQSQSDDYHFEYTHQGKAALIIKR